MKIKMLIKCLSSLLLGRPSSHVNILFFWQMNARKQEYFSNFNRLLIIVSAMESELERRVERLFIHDDYADPN